MVGLGETVDEIKDVLHDLRQDDYKMLTIGKYFTPSDSHVAVERYYTRAQFDGLWHFAESIGFENVTSGPLVRSTYYADRQSGLLLGKAH
jgi:lipoic acid synthetase